MAGLGVLGIGAGILFMFSGATDRWVVDVIRALIDGKSIGTVPPSGKSHFGPFVTDSGSGSASSGGGLVPPNLQPNPLDPSIGSLVSAPCTGPGCGGSFV